jgi:hypothetical protein
MVGRGRVLGILKRRSYIKEKRRVVDERDDLEERRDS